MSKDGRHRGRCGRRVLFFVPHPHPVLHLARRRGRLRVGGARAVGGVVCCSCVALPAAPGLCADCRALAGGSPTALPCSTFTPLTCPPLPPPCVPLFGDSHGHGPSLREEPPPSKTLRCLPSRLYPPVPPRAPCARPPPPHHPFRLAHRPPVGPRPPRRQVEARLRRPPRRHAGAVRAPPRGGRRGPPPRRGRCRPRHPRRVCVGGGAGGGAGGGGRAPLPRTAAAAAAGGGGGLWGGRGGGGGGGGRRGWWRGQARPRRLE